ncbi:hypothetical protein Ddc_23216 [Ditylenchus destructor]|nr:hypothetical protein Ddc_23216 [Ditylenchus destructor]
MSSLPNFIILLTITTFYVSSIAGFNCPDGYKPMEQFSSACNPNASPSSTKTSCEDAGGVCEVDPQASGPGKNQKSCCKNNRIPQDGMGLGNIVSIIGRK